MAMRLSNLDAFVQLSDVLRRGHRALVSLHGDLDWAVTSAKTLCGELGIEELLSVTTTPIEGINNIHHSRAYQYLGREFTSVIFDLRHGLHPDALGALVGCVCGGGIVFLCWGGKSRSAAAQKHLRVDGFDETLIGARTWQRLWELSLRPQHFELSETEQLQTTPLFQPIKPYQLECEWTSDQECALEAVLKVMTGRRRRPLLFEAARGRGKSTVLAEAILITLAAKEATITVVMPHQYSSLPLIERLSEGLGTAITFGQPILIGAQNILRLLTMEQALSTKFKSDIIIVDEAACFPVHMLLRFTEDTSRLVFSTTTAGYEGTGQGFRLRFDPLLKERYVNRRRISMETPIRWASQDPVEAWLNDVFCSERGVGQTSAEIGAIKIQTIDRDALVKNEALLHSLIGLLTSAHHRTTPSDFQRILDGPNIEILAACHSDDVLGVCVLAKEGGLGGEMAQQIYEGSRRPQGHLMAETLCAHCGVMEAATLRYLRVVRIAVAAAHRRRGIGKQLLEFAISIARNRDVDCVGASFGMTPDLLSFWSNADFQLVRLGVARGRSSGLHSALVARSLTSKGEALTLALRRKYERYFPECLSEGLKELDYRIARALFREMNENCLGSVDPEDEEDVHGFISERQGFEVVSPSIKRFLTSRLSRCTTLSDPDWAIVIQKIFQHRAWSELESYGVNVGSRGLGQNYLRLILRRLYSNEEEGI